MRSIPPASHHVSAENISRPSARYRVAISSKAVLSLLELQTQYQNFKTTLQQLAQKIGDIEQETEEHK
jgi:hypothetical protein